MSRPYSFSLLSGMAQPQQVIERPTDRATRLLKLSQLQGQVEDEAAKRKRVQAVQAAISAATVDGKLDYEKAAQGVFAAGDEPFGNVLLQSARTQKQDAAKQEEDARKAALENATLTQGQAGTIPGANLAPTPGGEVNDIGSQIRYSPPSQNVPQNPAQILAQQVRARGPVPLQSASLPGAQSPPTLTGQAIPGAAGAPPVIVRPQSAEQQRAAAIQKAKLDVTGKLATTDEGVFQGNPDTGGYDIRVGSKAPKRLAGTEELYSVFPNFDDMPEPLRKASYEWFKNVKATQGQNLNLEEQTAEQWQKENPGKSLVDYARYKSAERMRENASRAQIDGLSPQQLTKATTLASQFDSNPAVKAYVETANRYTTISRLIDSGLGGPADLAAVFEFMKGLDPTSVVRESEYATAAKSGNIFRGAFARFNGYLKEEGGFLPENVKQAFKAIVATKLQASSGQVKALHTDFSRRIDNITGKTTGADYLTDYSEVLSPSTIGTGGPKKKPSEMSNDELLKAALGQ